MQRKTANLDHNTLIAILKENITEAIAGDKAVKLFLDWKKFCKTSPFMTQEESKLFHEQDYDYSDKDVDKAFDAFDDASCEKIVSLSLVYSKLKRLPESVRRLKNLEKLFLKDTGITRFPLWFSEFKHLKTFSVETQNWSRLFDNLEPLLDLPSLEDLHISDDHTRSIVVPDLIGNLKNLKKLSLTGTTLREVPEWIRHFSSLNRLLLLGPWVDNLPEWIGDLTLLEELWLCDTPVRELPVSIGNLTALKKLVLNSNEIPELPDTFVKLVNLEQLSLVGMGFSGERDLKKLPDQMGNLSALQFLSLYHTEVSSLPESMAHCKALRHLDIRNTQIKNIPECIKSRYEAGTIKILVNDHVDEG
jgi:Leucine-rich repeat (LRR) protein